MILKSIAFNDLKSQWDTIEKAVWGPLLEALRNGQYIGGKKVAEFEASFSRYTNSTYAIGTSNGTDALKLSLCALGLKGNVNVVIPANTFISNAFAVSYQNSATYALSLVDCDEYYQIDCELLEDHLATTREKYDECVITPVHLYGHAANMKRIQELAKKYNCYVIEDASQAHGAKAFGAHVGSFSDICAYSLYPGKNLGAAGDAGIITCNDEKYDKKIRSLRNLGCTKKYYHDEVGWNNRLDPIQAIILSEKLKFLDEWTQKKDNIVRKYDEALCALDWIKTPKTAEYVDVHGHHLYVIRITNGQRKEFCEFLNSRGIPTIMHYPVPIHQSIAYKSLGGINSYPRTVKFSDEIVSLPLHPFLTGGEINTIVETIKGFGG